MMRISVRGAGAAIALVAGHVFAQAPAPTPGPPPEFLKRVADNYRAAFEAADRNRNGALTRDEARGDLLLQARFDDIDTNRDGVLSREELERFLQDIPPHAR